MLQRGAERLGNVETEPSAVNALRIKSVKKLACPEFGLPNFCNRR